MGTRALNGIFRAMTQRVRRQQELIDQQRCDLESLNLEVQSLARELAVVIDEVSRQDERYDLEALDQELIDQHQEND
jgi:hypothetical protein